MTHIVFVHHTTVLSWHRALEKPCCFVSAVTMDDVKKPCLDHQHDLHRTLNQQLPPSDCTQVLTKVNAESPYVCLTGGLVLRRTCALCSQQTLVGVCLRCMLPQCCKPCVLIAPCVPQAHRPQTRTLLPHRKAVQLAAFQAGCSKYCKHWSTDVIPVSR